VWTPGILPKDSYEPASKPSWKCLKTNPASGIDLCQVSEDRGQMVSGFLSLASLASGKIRFQCSGVSVLAAGFSLLIAGQ
jgi:hypothetical protein